MTPPKSLAHSQISPRDGACFPNWHWNYYIELMDKSWLKHVVSWISPCFLYIIHPKRFAESSPNLKPLNKSMPDLNKRPTFAELDCLGSFFSRPGHGIHGPYGFCMCFVSSGHLILHQPRWPYGCRYLLDPNWDRGRFPGVFGGFWGGWCWRKMLKTQPKYCHGEWYLYLHIYIYTTWMIVWMIEFYYSKLIAHSR